MRRRAGRPDYALIARLERQLQVGIEPHEHDWSGFEEETWRSADGTAVVVTQYRVCVACRVREEELCAS